VSFEDIHDNLNHVNLNYLFRKIFLKVKVFSVLGSVAFLALALTEGVLLFGATPAEHFHAVTTEYNQRSKGDYKNHKSTHRNHQLKICLI